MTDAPKKQAEASQRHAEQTKRRADIESLKKRLAVLRSRVGAAQDPWIQKLEALLAELRKRRK